MTIAINATTAKMGGALTYLLNLIELLDMQPSGYRYVVFVSIRAAIPQPRSRSIALVRISERICDSSLRLLLWQQLTLPHLLRQYGSGLLFSTANFATFFSPCRQVLLIRIPHYFSDEYRTAILPKKSHAEKINFALRRLLIMLSVRASTQVMFPSKAMQDGFAKHCFDISSKSNVNRYGVPVEKFEPYVQNQKSSSCTRILCTSHYSDYKNYTTLFQALLELKKDGLDFHFSAPINLDLPLFAKTLTAKMDRTLIRQLGDLLHLLGPIPYSRLPELYRKANIFVWPSLSESFGHPLIEAMAARLPIVCSDIPVNRELCGDAALYVPPLDAALWARTIRKLASDPELQSRLIRKGQVMIGLFAWKDHISRLLRLFSQYE